ncbi:MAG: hypothetical protein Q9216_007186 [Gyalolechia sp. 2 TL-2023]
MIVTFQVDGLYTIQEFNYILWIQELLDTTSDDYRDAYDPDREVIGLDMYVLSPYAHTHPHPSPAQKKETISPIPLTLSNFPSEAQDPAASTPSSAAPNVQNGNS